jgi:hypothetical protein
MRSSLTSASRFRFLISLVACGCGCGDDGESCGPGDAPVTGIIASTSPTPLEFGNLTGSPNNDCPDLDGVVSLTIQGRPTTGAGFFVLCVERPDRLNGPLALGIDEPGNPVRVINVDASADNCTYSYDSSVPPTGTATGEGVCANGEDPAGFSLVMNGNVTLERTCSGITDSVAVTLTGRVAVAGPSL